MEQDSKIQISMIQSFDDISCIPAVELKSYIRVLLSDRSCCLQESLRGSSADREKQNCGLIVKCFRVFCGLDFRQVSRVVYLQLQIL